MPNNYKVTIDITYTYPYTQKIYWQGLALEKYHSQCSLRTLVLLGHDCISNEYLSEDSNPDTQTPELTHVNHGAVCHLMMLKLTKNKIKTFPTSYSPLPKKSYKDEQIYNEGIKGI